MRSLVSVVIPVYNDTLRLRKCLDALSTQTYPHDRFEIVIVDNGSTDDITHTPLPENARLLSEAKPGAYAARNTGVRASKGDIIAFTEADCIPADEWLEKGVSTLENHPAAGLVGGQIRHFFREGKPNMIERYDDILYARQHLCLWYRRFAATGNAFVARSVFESVGFFKEEFYGSGDVEWGRRVFDSQVYHPVYAADALVFHSARSTLPSLYSRARRTTGGQFQLVGGRSASFRTHLAENEKVYETALRSLWTSDAPLTFKLCATPIEVSVECVRLFEVIRLSLGGKVIR